MPVNLEVKGMLAKCLAMEDIVVEHKKVETAQFNVHTRVLTLPLWEKASDSIYTLLVLHEISHSLWTPNIDWTKEYNIPGQFVNIVEDARIEKLCKRKYPGSPKTFYNGYKEFSEQDFFAIGDDDLSTYNLADRANLLFKIGNFVDIPIENGEETEIINQIADAETFDDVLIAAEALYKYCKQKQKADKESLEQDETAAQSGAENQQSGSSEQPASDFSDENDGKENTPSGSSGNQDDQKSNTTQSNDPSNEEPLNEPEIKTMESLEESVKELANSDGVENVYLEIPQLDLNKIIVSNSEIHQKCNEHWNSYLSPENTEEYIFGEVDTKYREFKRSAQKEVNYLVKEFECRKAADSYARATTARTGVLDCSRLHTYKFNDDLFKKVTTLADGKNHGLIFILDWSGSMGHVLMDTLKQLYNLIWFCRKVSIPFEVYAFTCDYPHITYDENNKPVYRDLAYKKKGGLIQVAEWFSMMNFFTSKVNTRDLEKQMLNIFRVAHSFNWHTRYHNPNGLSLSGTPLNESLIALHHILPKFQKENKLQKVQCIVLTDGEGSPLKYHQEIHRHWENDPFLGINYLNSKCILRDRKIGHTYSFDCEWNQITDVLLRNLRDKFPNTNFIGIRVIQSRDVGSFIRRYCGYYGSEFDRVNTSWRKEKSFSLKNSGYHTYFGLSSSALSQETEFDVAEDATKSQIKNAFIKSLKTKKMNKRILGEFISLVA